MGWGLAFVLREEGPERECSVQVFQPLPATAHEQHFPQTHPQIGSVGKRERKSIKPGMVGQAPGSTCAPVHGERTFC